MATIRCKSAFLMRSDTAKNWKDNNPVLRQGEEGYETDTGKRKIGNGSAAWKNLPYCDDALYKAIDDSAEKLTSDIASTAQKERSVSNNIYSNALKGSVSGKTVKIEDISPIGHTMGVKVRSKNLIPFPYLESGTVTQNGLTIIFNTDGTFTVSGTSTSDLWLKLVAFSLPAGRYKFTGCPQGANASTYLLRYGPADATDTKSDLVISDGTATTNLWLYVKKGNTLTEPKLFKPQIELGSISTQYTPNVGDLTDVKITTQGRNLINNNLISTPEIGLTLSAGTDGSYNISGTLTKDWSYFSRFPLNIPAGTTVTSTSWYSGPEGVFLGIVLYGRDDSIVKQFNTIPSGIADTAILTADCVRAGLVLRFTQNEIGDSITIKNINTQLEIGSTATSYEPYIKPTTYTPLKSGTVERVTSLYPTTTLLTDTDGVIINCEYNRDINKAFSKLYEKFSSLEAANTNN